MYNFTPIMEGIYAIRRARVIQIVQERFEGNRAAFGREAGLDHSLSSAYVRGAQNIGERLARRIERDLGLTDGWLDMEDRRRKRRVPLHPLRAVGHSQPRKVHSLQKLLSAGYSQREIARQLGVHESTVSKALKRERERPQHAAA